MILRWTRWYHYWTRFCTLLIMHQWTNRRGHNAPGNKSDANEKEPENTMVVWRRAAQVGERWQVWKVNSIPNAKRNASKIRTTTLVFMGWTWNTESASFQNFKSVRLMSSGTMKVRRARMALRQVGMRFYCCPWLIPTLLMKVAKWRHEILLF